MEIVPKQPSRNLGTWFIIWTSTDIVSASFFDSLFIALSRLRLKLSPRCLDTSSKNYSDIPPRGAHVFILGSAWSSGRITAVSHHPILSCLDTHVTSGLLHSCHSQMRSGDIFDNLEHLDSGSLPIWTASSFSLIACPNRTCLRFSFRQWLISIIVVFPRIMFHYKKSLLFLCLVCRLLASFCLWWQQAKI